jgi:DnaJ-class molecular chaperone
MNNLQVIKKTIKQPCYCCHVSINGKTADRKSCKACGGTGIYKDSIFYFTNGKIAIDGDTLK